jgi:hypothetical protein
VEVRGVFLKIGEIDTLKEQYHADAFIQTKWKDPSLKVEHRRISWGIQRGYKY